MRPITEIDYPQTAEEYWALVEKNRSKLENLVTQFHPMYRIQKPSFNFDGPNFPITAQQAEDACEFVRSQIVNENKTDPLDRFNEFVKTKNPDIVGLFNEVWFGMPESADVRSVPGFGLLCDLCSEGDVLYD